MDYPSHRVQSRKTRAEEDVIHNFLTMQKKEKMSNVAMLGVIGASLAGIAATAYFFFGPKGKIHQKHARAWVIKMKGEVVEQLERAREVTEPVYHAIVDAVAKEYTKGRKASKEEIEAIAKDLKKHWKSMSKLALAAKDSTRQKATPTRKKK